MTLLPRQYPGLFRRRSQRSFHRVDIPRSTFKDCHHGRLVLRPMRAGPQQQYLLRGKDVADLLRQAGLDADADWPRKSVVSRHPADIYMRRAR